MNESDVYLLLTDVFKTTFKRDGIVLHPKLTAPDVVGWDSLKQVEIVLALEEKFGIRIRTKELNTLANLGDLVALVVKKASPV